CIHCSIAPQGPTFSNSSGLLVSPGTTLKSVFPLRIRTDSAKSPSRRLLTSRLHPILGTSNWWVPSLGTGASLSMVLAQPLKNERLTPIVRRFREGSGHRIVFPEKAVVHLLKALRNGTSVFLLTDLTLKLRDSAVVIEEFGLKTRVTQL